MFSSLKFTHFMGVVEDIFDPLFRGRVRVRCFGFHTDNKELLPTEELPWATPMTPITSGSISEVGTSATGLKQGSWVIGFFRDGQYAQDPIIIGSIPSYSTKGDASKGFVDPMEEFPLVDGEDMPMEAYDYPASTTPEHKEKHMVGHVLAEVKEIAEPEYPFNHVVKTVGGTTIEIDDTLGAERICVTHPEGGFAEIHNEGIQVATEKQLDVFSVGTIKIESADTIDIYTPKKITVVSDEEIELTAPIIDINGTAHVDIDGGRIDLN